MRRLKGARRAAIRRDPKCGDNILSRAYSRVYQQEQVKKVVDRILLVVQNTYHVSLRFWPWTLYQFWTLKLHSWYSDHARCAALAFKLKPQNSQVLHTFTLGVTPLCQKKFGVQTRSSDYSVSILSECLAKVSHVIEDNIHEYLKV
jgi:hypothetical protein